MPYQKDDQDGYTLPRDKTRAVKPLSDSDDTNAAVELIRRKISTMYETEPEAKEELAVSEHTPTSRRSKHQEYMHQLSTSGKSLADIQVAWHTYYQDLPDHEKHQVWQEFYSQHSQSTHRENTAEEPANKEEQPRSEVIDKSQQHAAEKSAEAPAAKPKTSVHDHKQRLIHKVSSQSKRRKAHLKSLMFGFGMGGLVLIIAGFSFFNERILAPFISPSRVLSSTPLIIDENTPVGEASKIIIPKINLEVPVVYNETSIQEDDVQQALEKGILHYATTPEPGEKGNSVFFGHSSNNILNRGEYKFAFVLLSQLEKDDTFMLEKDGTRYVYRVFDKEVVPPTDVSVLDPHPDKPSIAALITCDPPGTSVNRLVVYGEQISPDPSENEEGSAAPESGRELPETLPSESPSLWSRIFD